MQEVAINYTSVLVAAIASFVVGWLWYGPLFGKQWMTMMGYTKESMKTMKMKPGRAMTLGFISMLVMAFVVANFAALWGAVGAGGALTLTFWIWLGFIATVLLGSVLWEDRAPKLYFFNIAYHFVALFVMTLVIVLWK